MTQLYKSVLVCIGLVLASHCYGFQKEVKETIERTLRFSEPGSKGEVIIDNINGSIEVTGYDGREVKMVARQTIFATSNSRLERAREEVTLEISERNNEIEIFVDAPYRQSDGSINYRGWRHYGYEVSYDFEVQVPRDADVLLKTINDGEIRVENVRGDYILDNINGGIEFFGAAGSGRVYALNGDVKVKFVKNPESGCYFGSLNGDVDVSFRAGFSADLRFKTFNGDVFTDFDVTYLAPRQASVDRKKGKYVYKSDRSFGARVGSGGPELEFDAFNGDIHVIKTER